MTNTSLLFSKHRAVSPVVSVLLMVGVALALSGFVGLYMTSYVSSASRMVSLAIVDAELFKLSGHVYLQVTLRNMGSVPVKVVSMDIYAPSRSYSSTSLSISIPSGGTASITEKDLGLSLSPDDFTPGTSYLLRVFAESGGSRSAYSVAVTCQG